MRHIRLFENFRSDQIQLVHIISTKLEKLGISISDALLLGLQPILQLAENMTMKGQTLTNLANDKMENLPARIMRDAMFPESSKFVQPLDFNKLNGVIFYRGTSKRWVSSLKGAEHFMGQENIYSGTWITDDRKYAESYSLGDEGLVLEIKLDKDIKIAEPKDIDNIRSRLAQELSFPLHGNKEMWDEINKIKDEQDKNRLWNQATYVKDYLNNTMISMGMGYDAIRVSFGEKNRNVLVVLDQSKMNIKDES